ncbi:receptor-like kinase TMK4 isoform X1 [Cannabis sativa]|uniref:receptor-like kinase TMK4 isoform X1 n=1 Tax=Cannabis sativa TaxID=3483 RepID=UPI0029CA8C44|nr:receptor-like kinase TMK4 isoform X1 [Cannabis sativa]
MGILEIPNFSFKIFPWLLFLCLILATSTADESAVMSKLLSVISPAPMGWSSIADYCSAWDGIKCSSGKVTVINLRDMSLIGTLPSDLGTLSQLTTLSLQGNHFKGSFPSMANLSLLQSIYLDGNSFTSIPSGCFQGLTNLQTLSISTNINLAPWSFPAELVGSSRLVTLYAKSCNMFGTIPDIFGSFSNLQDVRLSYNNLTGVLPLSFAGSGIRNLWLNNQQMGLSGTIEVLANMTSLYQLWLHKNMFTGPIPDLSNSDTLFDLQLGDNLLMGIVPDSLSSIPSLKNITLANNTLQGPMPLFPKSVTNVELDGTNSFCKSTPGPCDTQVMALLEVAGDLGYPTVLAKSWKNNNACSDWSFVVCDSDGNVIIVNFQRLGFLGKISSGFANLTSLKKLYLDDNGLTGSIPSSLTLLPQLQVLDVSNNNLTGDIPSFPPRVKFTTTGNLLLGKTPSSESGGSSGSGSGSSNSTDGSANGTRNGNRVSAGMIAGIVIAVIIFVLFVLFVSYKCFVKKFGRVENHEIGKASAMDSELQSQNSGDHNDFPLFEGGNVAISMQVLRQATNNFSEDNILGRGSFGVVYKGELDNGTKIAAKRMESNAMGTKRLNEFQAEIAVLTKVRHKNLVSLLGYCINGHERLLVYEYMAQGTLNQHLFDWQKNGISPLTWKQRVTIALDVARGVEYLHSLAQQSFIHRDLKPSNILLDDLMRAKVADFGLVKHVPHGRNSFETRLAGTFGYLAPEYAETGRVTTKVDVYAFGVVLMEIITGRKAVDDTVPDERSHLVTWFSSVLNNKENILMAIDEALDPDEETMVESIYKVVELARHCTARNPYLRPDMGHVVNILGSLVEQWKPSCQEDDEKMVSRHERNMSLPQALERWQTDKGTFTMFDDISFRGVHQTTHTT